MPPVRDLDRCGCAEAGSLGVGARAVAADDLNSGVVDQPPGQGGRFPVREHVHGPARLDVDQDGSVDTPLAQGEVVNSQHPGCGYLWVGQCLDQSQQGGAADRGVERFGQSGPGPARKHQGYGLQVRVQAGASASVAEGQAGDLFDEGRARAPGCRAAEPPDPQPHDDTAATHR